MRVERRMDLCICWSSLGWVCAAGYSLLSNFHFRWKRKYLRLTNDKIVITVSSHAYKGWNIPLNELKVSLSELEGHDGKYNCFMLKMNDGIQYYISVSSRDELETWTRSIDSVANELNNSMEGCSSFNIMPY